MSISQLFVIVAIAFLVGHLKWGRSLVLLGVSAFIAGPPLAGSAPVLFVNEPIFVASKGNAPVRCDAVYPRWVYDRYRQRLATQAQNAGWNYVDVVDVWDAILPEYFADARFHLNAEGERLLVGRINPAVQSTVCDQEP